MSTLDDARAIVSALPETTEQPHHHLASFRVRGKIFASVPDDEHLRVMLDEAAIEAAIAEHPEFCEPHYWGKKLSCVVVALRDAPQPVLQELLTDAWLGKAPAALAQALPQSES